MLSVLFKEKEGYSFYCELTDGEKKYGGGLKEGLLGCAADCPYKELMLRTLINKCMNAFVKEVRARDEWGTDLARFGFEKEGEFYVAGYESLKLPHDCGH